MPGGGLILEPIPGCVGPQPLPARLVSLSVEIDDGGDGVLNAARVHAPRRNAYGNCSEAAGALAALPDTLAFTAKATVHAMTANRQGSRATPPTKVLKATKQVEIEPALAPPNDSRTWRAQSSHYWAQTLDTHS